MPRPSRRRPRARRWQEVSRRAGGCRGRGAQRQTSAARSSMRARSRRA